MSTAEQALESKGANGGSGGGGSGSSGSSCSPCSSVWLKAWLDEGVPGPEHFTIKESEVDLDSLEAGGILLRSLVMSVDPYLRGGLKNRSEADSTGERVMSGFVAGRVEASKSDTYAVGDLIGCSANFSTLQILSAQDIAKTLIWKLPAMVTEDNISLGVGALGMPGSTAYGGLIDVLRPEQPPATKGNGDKKQQGQRQQTLFVSAASGAVGSLVGQIAKNVYGCTVIGSCGGPEKGEIIKARYGFDHAIDYRALPVDDRAAALAALTARLKECAPEGIDMYFENVGGVHFEAAMASLRKYGRVAVCGCISGYNEKTTPANSLKIGDLIYSFQRIEGFVCLPWLSGAQGNFLEDMSAWIQDGRVKTEETFFDGIERWPEAFQSLFTGKKLGKVVVRV